MIPLWIKHWCHWPLFASLRSYAWKSTYFPLEVQLYKQVEGAPVGSPLSPVLADLYMEYWNDGHKKKTKPPSLWYQYMDHTFVIQPHGHESLDDFLSNINSLRQSIEFTMETEKDRRLPFLDVLVQRKAVVWWQQYIENQHTLTTNSTVDSTTILGSKQVLSNALHTQSQECMPPQSHEVQAGTPPGSLQPQTTTLHVMLGQWTTPPQTMQSQLMRQQRHYMYMSPTCMWPKRKHWEIL